MKTHIEKKRCITLSARELADALGYEQWDVEHIDADSHEAEFILLLREEIGEAGQPLSSAIQGDDDE